jgi:hypothetical protein
MRPVVSWFAASLGAAVVFGAWLPACTPVETVTVVKNPMARLAKDGREAPPRIDGRTIDPSAPPEEGIRSEDEAGVVTLRARTARHVMVHIYTTLANNERELFVEQVLSKATREEMMAAGIDPKSAFDDLVTRQQDVLRLFHMMPMGEASPGVRLQTLGPSEFRLAPGAARRSGLPVMGMDLIVERGEWRLRRFL